VQADREMLNVITNWEKGCGTGGEGFLTLTPRNVGKSTTASARPGMGSAAACV